MYLFYTCCMKKFFLSFYLFAAVASVFAQLNSSGFYRVINVQDSRYVYVTDNTGSASATSPDLKAVQLKKGLDKAVSDPASVLYFNHVDGNKYNILAQGTSVTDIIGYTPSVYYSSRAQAYQVYATVSGATIYLGSDDDSYYQDKAISYMSTSSSGNYNLWNIYPITADGDNYFGIKPSIEIGGKYYHSFYADFAFSFASSGMKAYYVSSVSGDEATLVEITDEIIPERTPVIIECSSSSPSDNRLNLYKTGGTQISGNVLKGVFFCNPYRAYSSQAVTKNDKNTMRVLGKTSSGQLGLVVSSDKNLPANCAYVTVPSGSSTEIVLSTDATASIENIEIESNGKPKIYSILGTRYDCQFDELPAGIYIINGNKVIKK